MIGFSDLICCPGGSLDHFGSSRATSRAPGDAAPTPTPEGSSRATPRPTPPPTPRPTIKVPPAPPPCHRVQFIDAPASHKHLMVVVFELMPRDVWGSSRGCSFGGFDRVCPVYISTKTFPGATNTRLFISLWKDAQTARDHGSWVMTWARARNKPIDQGNLAKPYGPHAVSVSTRALDVTTTRGWPGGSKFHCLDKGPPPATPAPPPSPGQQPPGPTPPPGPPTPAPTTITTTTTPRPTWATGATAKPTASNGNNEPQTTTTNGKCAECLRGSGFCMKKITPSLVICTLYTDVAARSCGSGSVDCTKGATLAATQTTKATPPPTPPPSTAATPKATWPPLFFTTKSRILSTVRITAPSTTSSTLTLTTSTTTSMLTTTTPIVKSGTGATCEDGYSTLTSKADCTRAAQRLGLLAPPVVLQNRNGQHPPGCFYFPSSGKKSYIYMDGDVFGDAPGTACTARTPACLFSCSPAASSPASSPASSLSLSTQLCEDTYMLRLLP